MRSEAGSRPFYQCCGDPPSIQPSAMLQCRRRNQQERPPAGSAGLSGLASPTARKSPSVSTLHVSYEIMWLLCSL